jgi:hypothetical protein
MIECRFVKIKGQGRVPYVKKLISYNIGEFEGVVEYDGYFYVDDEDLPIRAEIYISVQDASSPSKFNVVNVKTVEIYMREKMEDTSRCDDDGVCLFPTCKEKVYFRVLS